MSSVSNEEERRKDAHDREAIVAHLKEQLRNGDKSLVGNKGYRRYLKVEGSAHFVIDEKQVKAEERYDGIWVKPCNRSTPFSRCRRSLRGFVSPLGSRARQTSMSGSLGTLALYATPPIQSIRQSWASSGGVDGVNSFSHWPIITDSRHYPKLAVSTSSTCSRK